MRIFDTHPNLRWTSHEAPNRTREEWIVHKKQALLEVNKSLSMRRTAHANFHRCGNDTPTGRSRCLSWLLQQRLPMISYLSGLYSKFRSWNAGIVDAQFSSATLLMVRWISCQIAFAIKFGSIAMPPTLDKGHLKRLRMPVILPTFCGGRSKVFLLGRMSWTGHPCWPVFKLIDSLGSMR